jgi:iron complex outermembrane receptor protein
MSVSLLGAEDLSVGKAGVFLEEALQALPGLQIQNRFNFSTGERIILRGVGSRTQFGVRGIRILIDGIPATLPDGQSTLDHLDLPSVGGVEVLRGPGASLYGNGAGAVIRFRTRAPAAVGLSQEVLLLSGAHGLRRASALSSGTIGSTGYLISAGRLEFNGFREIRGSGGRTYGKLRRWNGNGQLARTFGGGDLLLTLNFLEQESENPGSLSRALMKEEFTQAYDFNVRQKAGEEVLQASVGLSWQRDLRGLQIRLGTHGIRRDLWNPIPPAIIDLERNAGGLSAELQGALRGPEVGGETIRVVWGIGGELDGQWDSRTNLENDGGEAGPLILDQNERVLGSGGFVHAAFELGERGNLLTGLRYDRLVFRARDNLVTAENPDDSGSRSMEALSPSVGLRIRLGEGLSLKGSASTFFQTPTTSELANQPSGAGGFNGNLAPQKGRSIEGGILLRIWESLQAEATLFSTHLRDELIPFQLPEAPDRVYFRNAGRSTHTGVEVGLYTFLPGGLTARGAYTYLRPRFEEFTLDGEDLAGNRIPGVAPHRVEGLARWSGVLTGNGTEGFLEIRGLYQGEIPVNDQNTGTARPYALVALRMGVEVPALGKARWSVFGGITNVLDRHYAASISVNAFGGRFFEPGPGRSFYLGIRPVFTLDGG